MLVWICILGEIISVLSVIYIDYFGEPKELFRNYDPWDGLIKLYMIAIFGGWITFPFFIYAIYEQIQLNK